MKAPDDLTSSLHHWLDNNAGRVEPLYLVGGTVRDLLLDSLPKDIDLVCRHAKEFASDIALRKKAALVAMEKKPGEPCYRVVDREDPESFLDIAEMRGETIYEDLGQRDFTINAMSMEIDPDYTLGRLIDPLDGSEDILQKTIRMAGSGTFVSDPLRVLRALRFAAALDFTVEATTWKEMQKSGPLLRQVAAERVMTELMLILKNCRSSFFFSRMEELGILEVVFPEITPMKGCTQNGYHHKDVWEHSLLVMENLEHITDNLSRHFGDTGDNITRNITGERLALLKLASLLHDVGKPATKGLDPGSGRITFYGHAKEGARLIDKIAVRLKMPNSAREFLVRLVAEHLHALLLASKKAKPAASIRWLRKMKDDAVPAIILSMADVMSSLGPASGAEYRQDHLIWAKKSICDYYAGIKARLESPGLITGDDLIALGLHPGPQLGQVLTHIRRAQDSGEITTSEEALNKAKALLSEK